MHARLEYYKDDQETADYKLLKSKIEILKANKSGKEAKDFVDLH
jgi:hypothetical protein